MSATSGATESQAGQNPEQQLTEAGSDAAAVEASGVAELPDVAREIIREGKIPPHMYPWNRPGWKVRRRWLCSGASG